MPTVTRYEHGAFSWAELATTDSLAAKKFYGKLFGWTFEDMPAGPGMTYTMNLLGKERASALFQMGNDRKGVPPHWEAYITVDDVDAVTKKAAANGGTVVKEPFDVMDKGRMSVIKDPTGALFCLWTAKKSIGAEVIHDPGSMTWNELFTGDIERAGKFYTSTLGWTTNAHDMGPQGTYTLFNRPGGTGNVGGMMPLGPQMKGVPPHWLTYFEVKDVDASARLVSELGGKVVTPPVDIPNIGRFAIAQDPQGAAFAIYKNAH
jgi:predicted enzyme related to lactoylglutathione lyase